MYAERNERTGKYNIMELTEQEISVIEFGLCSIHMNSPEHSISQKLAKEIDNELKDTDSKE